VKPARGAGGSGIVLITDRQASNLVKPSGEVISWIDLTYHIFDILSGIYSLEGLEDRALIEAFIHPDPVFAAVTYYGVPDIRIVVYRGVPVMGMVRLPTKASDGKANLHRGAIGVGINMKEGTTSTAVHRSIIINHHPDTNHPLTGIQVPYWKEMLHMAALTSEMTGLGYLGVDMVIDKERGPLLLELNARPGLQIQVANQRGLRSRLELIDQAPSVIFTSPEKRVEWAVQAFAKLEA
jgi:alpha-L-glutamate ligase-like protein